MVIACSRLPIRKRARPNSPRWIEGVADPEKPIGAEAFVNNMFGGYLSTRQIGTVLKVIPAAGLVVVGLALVWEYVPRRPFNPLRCAKLLPLSLAPVTVDYLRWSGPSSPAALSCSR